MFIGFFSFFDSAGNEAQQHQTYALVSHPKQQISIIIFLDFLNHATHQTLIFLMFLVLFSFLDSAGNEAI